MKPDPTHLLREQIEKTVLLSIKPIFAWAILSGVKRFEYRRLPFRQQLVTRAVIYASSPVMKVIGEFEVGKVITCPTANLWQQTHAQAGIVKSTFDNYFMGKTEGSAIEIRNPKKYATALDLHGAFGIRRPPQSFCYIPNDVPIDTGDRY